MGRRKRELERVSHLTKQTLGFYRETSAPKAYNVATLVREVVPLYTQPASQKGIKIDSDLNDAEVYGHGGELKQVISNLLSNAIEAVPRGGRVLVQTYQDDVVHLIVSDNGSGIPQDIRAKIFDPFFTTKKNIGTGLGLWVTKDIVEKHNGKIEVQSSSSNGAKFVVHLAGVRKAAAEAS